MKFNYAAEKFSMARKLLMLPHRDGEAMSVARAFNECSLGLMNLDDSSLDEQSRKWVQELMALMNTDGVKDPSHRGAHLVKAESLTEDQKWEVSNLVDELAYWFARN
jgi:hypothetical protein